MKLNFILILFFTFCFSEIALAVEVSDTTKIKPLKNTDCRLWLFLAIGGGRNYYGEIGLYRARTAAPVEHNAEGCELPGFMGYTIDLGNKIYFSNKFVTSPNISFNVFVEYVEIGTDIGYFTDFSENNVAITPHLGLTIYGGMKLYYNANIFFIKNGIRDSTNIHQLSLKMRVFNFRKR
jgi:hypothetical protein